MRIIQIIDSLEAGGAERMAVNYANALLPHVVFSGIVVTRKEGDLQNHLNKNVGYLFLNKKISFDLKALLILRRYVITNKINTVQAHSTSFFFAFLLKLVCPSIQLIWHDHYGDSEFLASRSIYIYKLILPFYKGIISVNQKLKKWTIEKVGFKNSIYLANFPSETTTEESMTILKGNKEKRIVSLANLRPQKNHFLLLKIAKKIKESHPEWTFHLVGKNFEDQYATEVFKKIAEYDLQETVFIYGSKNDIKNILDQSTIAIITSLSEGLPVALLEYGLSKKPVVTTNVGEIASVIRQGINGFIVAQNEALFYNAIVELIDDRKKRVAFGEALLKTVQENYSEQSSIKQYLNWLQKGFK